MIKHGYKLELTCDCTYCGNLKKRHSTTFSGDKLKETLQKATSAGWDVSVHLTRAYAPDHYRASRNVGSWR